MLQVKFQNQFGTLELHRKPCRILSIVGLGLPERESETVQYADSYGQETLHVVDQARTITLSLDLLMNRGLGQELAKMTKILYYPGTLIIRSEGKSRLIYCRCSAWEEDERTPVLAKIVLQFTCDDPAFLGETEEKEGVFERIHLIDRSFMLPMMFTKRITEKTIVNTGDLPVQPVIVLKCIHPGSENISITNTPYGEEKQLFQLTVPMLQGEEIRVDFPKRCIESSMRTGMIHQISKDTFMNSFSLKQGSNHMKVTAGSGADLSVQCLFSPRFLEGFY